MIAALAAAAVAAHFALNPAALQRASERLAIPAPEVASFVVSGEREGMTPDEVLKGLFSIGARAHEAKSGRDNEAAAAMSQLGLEMEYADGVPLVGKYVLDLGQVIRRQRDPYTQARICDELGCNALLPVLVRAVDVPPSAQSQ